MSDITKSTPYLKTVRYAYPTSQDAVRFGHGNTGCYIVYLHFRELNRRPAPIDAFLTFEEAEAYADTLPYKYSRYTMRLAR